MKNIYLQLEEKIRDQTRKPVGVIEEHDSINVKNLPPGVNDVTITEMVYLRELYYWERDSSFQIDPVKFRNYAGGKEKSIKSSKEGMIDSQPFNAYANIHYGIILKIGIDSSIELNFDIDKSVSMFVKYTYINDDDEVATVNVFYNKDADNNNVGDWYSGNNLILHDLPVDKWVRVNIYIYAHNGLSYFRQTSNDLGLKCIDFKMPDIIPPTAPTWKDGGDLGLSDKIYNELEVGDATIDTWANKFPWTGPAIIDGSDVVQYYGKNSDEISYVQLLQAEDIDTTYAVDTTIRVGFAVIRYPGSKLEGSDYDEWDFYTIRPDTWKGINDKCFIDIKWNNPTRDEEDMPIEDLGGIGVYEIEWVSSYRIVSAIIDLKQIFITGNHESEFKVRDNIRIGGKVYTINVVNVTRALGYPETIIELVQSILFEGGRIEKPRYTLVEEFNSEFEFGNLYNQGDGLTVGEEKYLALDAFDSSAQKNRSSKTSIRRVSTGIQDSPPISTAITVKETKSGIHMFINSSYFRYLIGHSITEIEWFHISSSGSEVPGAFYGTPNDGFPRTVINKGFEYAEGFPASSSVQKGISTSYTLNIIFQRDVMHYFAVKLTNGAGKSVFVGIRGNYQPAQYDFRPSIVVDFSNNNLITELSKLSALPYADTLYASMRRAYAQSYDEYLSPIAIIDLRHSNPPDSVTVESIKVKAIWWGTFNDAEGDITAVLTINGGTGYGADWDGLDLAGCYFIDNAGQQFIITGTGGFSDRVVLILDGKTLQIGNYAIIGNEDGRLVNNS